MGIESKLKLGVILVGMGRLEKKKWLWRTGCAKVFRKQFQYMLVMVIGFSGVGCINVVTFSRVLSAKEKKT